MEIKKIIIIAGISIALLGLGTYFAKNKNLGDSALPNTFLSATNGAISVGSATSSKVLSLNGVRQYAALCNHGTTTQQVYLSFGVPAVVDKGIMLFPMTCYEINNTKGYLGAVYAYSETGTTTVTYVEK